MQGDSSILRHPALPRLERLDSLTALCKATADAQRLKILRILRSDSLGVLEMSSILEVRQSALSHHLKVLATAGLVSTRRESNAIFYRRVFLSSDDPLAGLKAALFETVDRAPLDPALAERLRKVKRERDQQSRDFFNRYAARIKQKQDMVAESQQYARSLMDLLHELKLPREATVLEVGPGEGELLSSLADHFGKVVALDNSEEMLNKAKARAVREEAGNVEFVLGDTAEAVRLGLKARLIVVSMVLHHVSSPAEIFMDCASLLEDGGVMLIVDLCSHNQGWVREACGDLWLGFEPEELSNWALGAGFDSGQSLYLGLRNGFQIQIRLFHKRP